MPIAPDDPNEEWEGVDSGLPGDHSIEVYETENPVVGVIYGPAGDVLAEVRERPLVPFGFARWKESRHAP